MWERLHPRSHCCTRRRNEAPTPGKAVPREPAIPTAGELQGDFVVYPGKGAGTRTPRVSASFTVHNLPDLAYWQVASPVRRIFNALKR